MPKDLAHMVKELVTKKEMIMEQGLDMNWEEI